MAHMHTASAGMPAGLATVVALALASSSPVYAQLGTPIPGKALGSVVEEERGPTAFLENQLTFDRVVRARDSADERLRTLFEEQGLAYPAREIFLRVFKHERVMELWARGDTTGAFTLVREYPVCALPGQLGPKRRMGDVQVPEGFYFIADFNPRSEFHLSLRVDYPNVADRMRRRDLRLGGDIFVHGGCETVGCVPIEDRNIEEVYWLAVQATDAGQKLIPIHIFPARLTEDRLAWLRETFRPEADLMEFWRNLADGYSFFQATNRVPWVTVAPDGRYAVPRLAALAADSTGAGDAVADVAAPDSAGSGGQDPIDRLR